MSLIKNEIEILTNHEWKLNFQNIWYLRNIWYLNIFYQKFLIDWPFLEAQCFFRRTLDPLSFQSCLFAPFNSIDLNIISLVIEILDFYYWSWEFVHLFDSLLDYHSIYYEFFENFARLLNQNFIYNYFLLIPWINIFEF